MKAKVYTPNDLHKRLRKGGWISNAIPDQLKSSAGRTGTDGGGGYSIKGIPEMYIYCPQIGPLYLLLFVRNIPGSQPSLVLVHSSSTFSYLVCIKLISQSHSIRTFRKCDVALIASPTRGHSLLWHWLLQPTSGSLSYLLAGHALSLSSNAVHYYYYYLLERALIHEPAETDAEEEEEDAEHLSVEFQGLIVPLNLGEQ